MKRIFGLLVCLFILTQPVFAQQNYTIAVLQVSKIQVFDNAYEGFIETLKENGIVEGENLSISRHIIDADLDANIWEKKIPAIAFMTSGARGCILYIGPSLRTNGALTGGQAVKILKDGVKPEELPIARQENLTILSDVDAIQNLGIEIPLEILQLAQAFTESS
jgi:ABC-type uncharacterized transport system substrate-binding protein